jgi:Flp pilus assembly secretin CpaC
MTMGLVMTGILAVQVLLVRPSPAAEPADMIEVDVQVMQVNKTRMTKAGLDWARLLEGYQAGAVLKDRIAQSPANVVEQSGPPLTKLGTFQRGQVDAFVHMMQEGGYGKILATPKLLAISGSAASFLAGGEAPMVTYGANGSVTIGWREYGVKLSIKPEKREQSIRTHVRAEASELDDLHAVALSNGTYIPAIRTRWAETDVDLPARSTVIMAGLLSTEESKTSAGVPILSDLPLLGWIFRYTRVEHGETELVIFVTPSFVAGQAGAAGL